MSQPEDSTPASTPASPDARTEERIEGRAELLPEEVEAGSDDSRAQARVILEESDERTADPEGTRRASSQTPD